MEQFKTIFEQFIEQKNAAEERVKVLEAQIKKLEEDREKEKTQLEMKLASSRLDPTVDEIIEFANTRQTATALHYLTENIDQFSIEQLAKIYYKSNQVEIRHQIFENRSTTELWLKLLSDGYDVKLLYEQFPRFDIDQIVTILSDARMASKIVRLPLDSWPFTNSTFIDKLITTDNENCKSIITRTRYKLSTKQKVLAMKNGIIFDVNYFYMELVKEIVAQNLDIEIIRKNILNNNYNLILSDVNWIIILVKHYPKLHETAKGIDLKCAMVIWEATKGQNKDRKQVAEFLKKISDVEECLKFIAWAQITISPLIEEEVIQKEKDEIAAIFANN